MGIMREGASVVKKTTPPEGDAATFAQPNSHGTSTAREDITPSIYTFVKRIRFLSFFSIYFYLRKPCPCLKKHIIGLFSRVYCEYSLFLVEIFFCKIMLLDDERIRNWLLPSF